MKVVRALIVAVRLYTGRAVDVIGYSLGVPVSRKAILGGSLKIPPFNTTAV